MAKVSINELYDNLKADGWVEKDFNNFEQFFFAPGQQGYKNRKALYDNMKEDGYVDSPTYEEFMSKIDYRVGSAGSGGPRTASAGGSPAGAAGAQAQSAGQRADAPASEMVDAPAYVLRRGGVDQTVAASEIEAAGGLHGYQKSRPGAETRVYMVSPEGKVFHRPVDEAYDLVRQGWKFRTGKVRQKAFDASSQAVRSGQATVAQGLERFEKLGNDIRQAGEQRVKYAEKGESLSGQPAADGYELTENGELEQAFLTPGGERIVGRTAAEMVAQEDRHEIAHADQSVGAQIRRTEMELTDLRRQLEGSAERVHGEWAEDYEKNDAPLAFLLATNTYSARQQTDKENAALRVAIRQKEEQLRNLKEEWDRGRGKDVGFWRGFGRAVRDIRTWDFGMGDLSDAMTMLNADSYSGPDATARERRAGQQMLKAVQEAQETEDMTGENASFWNKAGLMTGNMLPFMLDFAATGGGFKAVNIAGKAASRGAAKMFGKAALKEIGKLGVKAYTKKYGVRGAGRIAGNWTVKALGTTADDLLIRAPLMTNTVQAGKTAADIIDRKLGDVVVDENGNYDFSNDKSWGSAVWQGEANAVIENYSEMFGAHLDGIAPVLAKTFGGKRISGMLARANASSYGQILKTTRKHFERLGMSDYFGEVGEEYYGQLWRTMLNLDDAYTNVPVYDKDGNRMVDDEGNPVYERKNLLFTGEFHGDIWGGMALSMGLMGAGKYTLSGIAYGKMKHKVNVADRKASEMLTPERWESLREVIDNTTNENMGSLAEQMVGDESLSQQERDAVLSYMERSMNLRGLNLGGVAQSRSEQEDEDGGALRERVNEDVRLAYEEGVGAVEAEDAEGADVISRRMREAGEAMEDAFGGEAEYWMYHVNENPWEVLCDPELTVDQQDAVLGYINARAALDGVMDASEEAAENRRAEVTESVKRRTHKDSGVIVPATMKVDNRQVYVVKGDVAMFPDGSSVDVRNSSESVIVMDAETGEYEFTSPDQIMQVAEAVDPQEEVRAAHAIIEQERMDLFGGNAVAPDEDAEADAAEVRKAEDEVSPAPTNAEQYDLGYERGIKVAAGFSDDVLDTAIDDLRGRDFLSDEWRGCLEAYEYEQQRRQMEAQSEAETATGLDGPRHAHDVGAPGLPKVEYPSDGKVMSPRVNKDGNSRNMIWNELDNRVVAYNFYNKAIHSEDWADFINILRNEGKYVPLTDIDTLRSFYDAVKSGKITMDEGRQFFGHRPKSDIAESVPKTEVPAEKGEQRADDGFIPIDPAIRPDENGNIDIPAPEAQQKPTPLQRVPRNEQGEPMFEQAESPETGWDALVEFSEGDAETAGEIAEVMVEEKRKAFEKARKLKPSGKTPTEIMASKKANAAREAQARSEYEQWQRIAGVEPARQEAVRLQQQEEQRLRDGASRTGETSDLTQSAGKQSGGDSPSEQTAYDALGDKESAGTGKSSGDAAGDGRRSGDMAEKIAPSLSEEKDDYGKPFVKASNGTTEFGTIEPESGLTEAPIRLSLGENYKGEDGKNHGYGLIHIEAGHGEQIRRAGFGSVEEFVESVARNYERIREGNRYGDRPTYLLEVSDGHNNTLFIQLSKDGRYWNVNSAGIFREKYSRRKPEVKPLPTIGSSSSTETAEVNHGHDKGATVTSGDSPLTSEGKDNALSADKQADGAGSSVEVTENKGERAVQSSGSGTSAEVRSEPTEAQKAAGNYKMVHRRVDGHNISIENAKGSVRRGTGADGKPWETTMQNDYGYIRGTEGVDGDHIDVFLSDTPEEGDVFVVDQVNEDGSFDEHKVMYGFPSEQAAREAYLSNYEPGWTGLGAITHVSKEEFKKWIQSSRRKTKPFAEYKSVRVYKEQNPQLAIEPDGFSDFGPVFTQFKGNAQGAIKVLSELQDGEAIGALHHKDIGDIDLVWGNAGTAKSDGYGLAKLVKYHPEVVEHLQEILDDMHIVKRSENRINLESDTHKAAVRLTWNKEKKKWLLTAFEKKETPKSIDKTTDTGDNPTDLRGGTALSQNSGVSGGKDNVLSADKQADGAERSEPYTITPTTYTNKKGKTSDVHLVKFNRELTAEEKAALDTFAREPLTEGKKTSRGWYDRKQGGYMMRSEEAARQLAEIAGNEKAVTDGQSMSTEDLREAVKSEPEEAQHEISDEEMQSLANEIRDILGIGEEEGDTNIKFRDPGELTPQERQRLQSAGIRMAMGLISRGTTSFPDYAAKMVGMMGDKIRPWLKSFYEGARWTPGYEKYDFTPSEEVAVFDVQNFDKKQADPIAQAAMIVEERKASKALAQLAEQRKADETLNGYKRGDEVMWDRYGNGKWEKVRIEDFDADGSPIFESVKGVMSEKGDWSRVKAADGIFGEARRVANKAKADRSKKENPEEKGWTSKPTSILSANGNGAKVEIPIELAKKNLGKVGAEFSNIKNAKGFIAEVSKALGSPTGMKSQSFYYDLIGENGSVLTLRLSNHNVNAMNHDGETPEISIVVKSRRQPNRFFPSEEAEVTEYVYFKEDIARGDGNTLSSIAKDIADMLETGRYADTSGIAVVNHSPATADATAAEVLDGDKGKKAANKKSIKPEQQVGDLFGGLPDEPIKDEKKTDVQSRPGTAERERGHEPQSHEPLGESQRNEVKGTDGRGMAGRDSVNPMSDRERGAGVSRKPKSQPVAEPLAESERKNVRNNHAERGVDYAPKGEDARIKANIEAIELAKRLLDAGSEADAHDMAVLRKFSGWGGLGKAFNESGRIPNPTSRRLRELLGEQGYQDAVDSRRSAYYTPAEVIDAMWDVARAMGFKGGNVLEGSAGIGNILGLMPADMSERSSIHAIEIDRTTGGILSLLYPDANVEIKGFEKTRVPNGSIDLAITNVPFVTGLRVMDETGDKDLSKKFHDIHDFCIAKNIRKLREGGIGIFITSSGTMDNSKELRRWITGDGNADVVGAFRMHNKTFGGTGATSDIIVVRKRVGGKPSPNAIDVTDVAGVRVADYDTGKTRKVKGQEIPIVNRLSMDYNKYFAEHPENMAGEMRFGFEEGDTFRPKSKALYPVAGKEQGEMLTAWAERFADMEEEATAAPRVEDEVTRINERLGEGVKEGSMVLDSRGELCMARMGEAVPLGLNRNKVKGHTKAECFEAYTAIKKALSDVLEYQSAHEDNEGLAPLLKELNRAFDAFTRTYGNLHKNTAISFLRNDVDFSSIMALETFSEKGDKKGNKVVKVGKTDIFSRRVIETEKEPQPTTIKDGILASLYKNGGVDVDYIGQALGKSTEDVKREIVESGLGFENPSTGAMEVSYQYLSGNVREKLHIAQENNEGGRYDANIKALEGVLPMSIPAHLIEFALGSSWMDPKLYEDFVYEKTGLRVTLTNAGGTWFMKTPWSTFNEKNRAMAVVSKMCDKTIMGHELIESAITNKQITVSKTVKHYDGTTETITDKSATAECGTKVDEIRAEFKDWARERMQADPDMSARIEQTYNEQFNNYVPMSIPDEFVPQRFGGQISELHGRPFALRPHQGKAVVRGTTEPILLAHEVGTGKTYTLITTAMEMRRLGTARKPMIVVQNATVGQFVESAKEIYPNAKVLTIEEADRTAEGRRNFYAKIKYNDWDMIVVPQSVFERIPDSPEREMAYVKEIIEEKMRVLEAMREADSEGRSMIVRQAERELAEQEERLAELTEAMYGKKRKRDEKREATTRQNAEVRALEMLDREVDDVENFDDMGIDAILVDEAHEYKHLGFSTAMQRGVKGVDPSYSKKSQGVYLKAQAVMERNNGRNVVFATGTPISNTAAEIWTFMRYLMPADRMKSYGIYYFDDFVRNFGNIAQMVEFGTNGKFKENNRFAGYVNLPELVRIWSGVADTVLTREAGGVSDKIPDMEGGKPQDIYLPQTRALRSVMKYVKAELDRFEEMSGKEKKENSHIPLTMYGIAKAAAVDVRLVVPNAEDAPNSKTNATVRETMRSLKDSAKYKGTVAIFADNYQNKKSGFNLYEDIRKKLIAGGIPAEQIVVIKPGMTVKKKLDIFEKVNAGEIRVIMGSTFTLGTGVNIQERLHTLIHVDAPNRPMDYTQRNGRALRQGNLHKDMGIPVRIIRFGVEDSLDVTAYQRLKTKGAIADSIMNGSKMMQNSMENRVLEEEEDSFGDMTAQLSGSEYAILKNQAEREVRSLTAKQKGHDIDQIYVHNQLPKVEGFIKGAKGRIELETKNLEIIGSHFPDGTIKKITIGKLTFDSVGAMDDFFKEQNAKMNEAAEAIREGADNYTSKLAVDVDGLQFEVTTTVRREVDSNGQGTLSFEPERSVTYSCEALGIKDESVKGNRLKNVMQKIADDIATGNASRDLLNRGQQQLAHYSDEYRLLQERNGREFPYKAQLAEAKERLAKYEEAMKKELEEKEAKYAEMDKSVDAASEVALTEESADAPTTGEGNRFRLVEEGEELDWLESLGEDELVHVYRNVQILPDGSMASPMAAYNVETGEIRRLTPGRWNGPEERQIILTPEQEEQLAILTSDGEINGKNFFQISKEMRFFKTKKDGVKLQFNLTRDGSKDMWADYNPYDHAIKVMLNDQFKAAWKRPNLVVVEAVMPKSEIEGAYKSPYAALPTGEHKWNNGRSLYLSRWSKIVRIVPFAEVAADIDRYWKENPSAYKGAKVTDYDRFQPQVREELEKLGYRFDDKGNRGSLSDAEREKAYKSENAIYITNEDIERMNSEIAGKWQETPATERTLVHQPKNEKEAEQLVMLDRVEELSEKLGVGVRVVTNQSDIDNLPSARHRRAKGYFDSVTGEVVIVLPNNVDVADVENTFVHEVVGHKGLRALIGEERFEAFLGEVYDHASASVRKAIDAMTDRMVNAEADRLRTRKAQARERAGEDVNANYYADMAQARVEAEKKREDFRKEATEEYMADLGGRIGSEGFARMSEEELTFWGRIKAKVQAFLDKFLQGLKIGRRIRLSDKDLSYILYKSWKNLREKRGQGGVFAEAEDAVMRYRTGWEDAMLSESAKIDDANNYFNRQLKRYINGDMNKNEMLHLGMPLGVMSQFLPELPIIMRQRVIRKGSEKKHEVDVESIMNMPQHLSSPIFVFQRSKDSIGVLTDMQDRNGKNVCVAIELKRQIQNGRECLEINDVRSFHGREFKNIVEPIVNNNTLKWVDKEKGLAYLSSASQPVQQEIDKEVLDSAAKIIKSFENPTFDGDKDLRFRDGADYVERVPVMARAMYEKQIQSSMYQFTEAMQDSMRGLMEFYKAVESQGAKRDIENVASFENAYIAENLMSSKSYAEMEEYEHRIMRPLLDIAARMSMNKRGRDELIDYMMAKHGLERNAHMRNEAIANGEESERDFAGLCGLTGEQDWQDAETAAQQIVNDYEAAHSADIADFWSAINKATKTSLKKVYDCGLMSKEQYEKIRDMYDYYVPLRGFDEKTSDDVYGYLTSKGGTFSSPITKAEGRKSKADDPLATIAYMAQNSIIQGNRNVMKQKFLTYVQNHPSDLASVNRLWLVHDETMDTWKPVFADVDENMTPDEIDKAVMDFEQHMESLSQSEPDKFKRGRDAIGIPYRIVDGNIKEHQVLVKRNGESYVITINGNPRAAQAVNGLTNPDNDLNGAIGKVFNIAETVNRQLSQFYTTRNPDFVVSNFIRDLIYSNTMVHIKENQGYAMKFHKNQAKVNPIHMIRLLHLYDTNKLNMHNPTHRMFYEFMHWGGETGYTMQRDLDQEKKLVAQLMKEARRGNLNPKSILNLIGIKLDQVNRGVENSARFAAFVTSRESGRDVQRSVYDAKEISVNFNKKGAGSKFMDAKGQTIVGKAAGFTSGLGRSFYVFWNAAVQGTANYAKTFRKHPGKSIMATTALVLLGYVMAALMDDGDDEDKNGYYNMPKYTRRSNLIFRIGEQWITIPLPVEYRALYGLGELAYGVTSGREEYSDAELAKETASQLSQIMPIDFMEGGGGLHAFVPSAFKPLVESATNTSWTGLPIYKDTPFNKDMPEWTKAYPRANAQLVDLSKWANEASGGNNYKTGWANFNPAQLEYLLNGYFGGYSNVLQKMVKTGETLFGEREYDPNNILLVNRLVKMGDERTAEKKLNSDFFQYLEEYKRTHTLLHKYEDEADRGVDKYRIFLDALKHSRDGARHDVMDEYIADYNWLNKAIKDPDITDEERMSYEDEMRRLKRNVVSLMKVAPDSVKMSRLREQFAQEYTQQ